MDRRQFLRGAAATTVVSAVVAMPALAGDDELGRLIEAHKAARAVHAAACEAYEEYEETAPPHPRRYESEVWQRVVDAIGPEQDALWDLIAYRPRDFLDVRRRADYMLSDPEWRHTVSDTDAFIDFVRSLSTLPEVA
jgi:FtsP/CotA-like multicopper oxidase with cupredoxin domain